jgi:hypothetical protein
MLRPRINSKNEQMLRTIYRKDGYMNKAVNLAIKEYFENHTLDQIIKQLQEARNA